MIERERAAVLPEIGGRFPGAGMARWLARFARTKPLGAIGGGITAVLILLAVLAPVVAPYGAKEAANPKYIFRWRDERFPAGSVTAY